MSRLDVRVVSRVCLSMLIVVPVLLGLGGWLGTRALRQVTDQGQAAVLLGAALHAAQRDVALQTPAQYASWATSGYANGVTPANDTSLFVTALSHQPGGEVDALRRLQARYAGAGQIYLHDAHSGRQSRAAIEGRGLVPIYLALASRLDADVRAESGRAQGRLSQIQWLTDFLRLLVAFAVPLLLLTLGGILWAQRDRTDRGASRKDESTNGGNEEEFVLEIQREVARARRHGTTVALALIQVDQQAGGRVITGLAALFEGRRCEDRSFRLAVDRFALLLPGTTARQVWPLMDDLRRQVEVRDWDCTVSVGIADLSLGTDSADGLRGRAEAALAEAGNQGHNAVVAYAVRHRLAAGAAAG